MMDRTLEDQIERHFQQLCAETGRRGIIGFSSVGQMRLLPEQQQYLQAKLHALGPVSKIAAVSLGLLYHEQEILAIPAGWRTKPSPDDRWSDYVHAYEELNRLLSHFSTVLTERFGGIAEQATLAGWGVHIGHVREYYPHCVSHRAFAEAAGLGWRGRHSLIVTPEVGPALRFATVFVPGSVHSRQRELTGCGDCRACLEVCPILRGADDHREPCRRRFATLGLGAEVCGICVRVCWEQVRQ
jgi:epoxyqueuosine reductase QueG